MRNIVYLDKLIPYKDATPVFEKYKLFIKEHTGITPSFVFIEYDFSDYPTVIDLDGDDVIRPNFLHEIVKEVDTKYGKYGTDNVITMIHEDNWKSGKTSKRKGIWGTNYSYKYSNYHVQYCRWDKKNPANTFGTLNHEIDHTFDALIKVEIGIDINPILGVTNYDADTTHGGKPPHQYIRYKENVSKLKILAPYLYSAYAKRLEKHTNFILGQKKTIINLLESLIELLRARLNRKNGIPN